MLYVCVGFRREKQTFSSAISMKTTEQACQLVVSCQLGGFPSYLLTHNVPSPVVCCKYNQIYIVTNSLISEKIFLSNFFPVPVQSSLETGEFFVSLSR